MADFHICAAIVTYNPDIGLLEKNISAVIDQVEHLYIYDNASTNLAEIEKLTDDERITIVKSDSNYGISKALNELCSMALECGYNWVLTLDHDTIICNNFIDNCRSLIRDCDLKIAIVCPRVKYVGLEIKEKGDVSCRFSRVSACMTSGSFMSLIAWNEVGGFDEYMVIDWVDNDICTNFVLHGYVIVRNNQIFMEHKLGSAVKRKFGLVTLIDYQYSAFRVYHIVRNGIYYRKKYRKNINQLKMAVINLLTRIKFRILYRKDKERFYAIKRGVKDGRNMLGKNLSNRVSSK